MSNTRPSTNSFLSSQKYGYDFVVATTQVSINAGIKEYLRKSNQPDTNIYFLADEYGNPAKQVTLDGLKALGCVDPFTIPAGTDYNDPRITKLTQNMFVAAIKLQLGLPPGILPKDLPPVVELGSSANNVTYNTLMSKFSIIQNSPPSGFGMNGAWEIWSQPEGESWHFTTHVDLTYKDLDKSLNTPYFNNHPDERRRLLEALRPLNTMAFSLQQLVVELNSAILATVPIIKGIPAGSKAMGILTRSFINIYTKAAKAHGEPIVSVHAVVNKPDKSSLQLTAVERQIGLFLGADGVAVPHPTPNQIKATTLQYLCAVNDHSLPGPAGFNWNWVAPTNLENQSGTVAINRNTLAMFFAEKLLPSAIKSCLKTTSSVDAKALSVEYSGYFTSGGTPTIKLNPSGADVVSLNYSSRSSGDDKWGLTYGELSLSTAYSCVVNFSGDQIRLTQRLWVKSYVQFDETGETTRFFDKTKVETYTISVDQHGELVLSAPVTAPVVDNSQQPDRSWLVNLFTGVSNVTSSFESQVKDYLNAHITELPATNMNNFIFPGGRVFAFKDAIFSDHQDLLAAVTYLSPS